MNLKYKLSVAPNKKKEKQYMIDLLHYFLVLSMQSTCGIRITIFPGKKPTKYLFFL